MTTSGGLLDTTLGDVIGARLCCPCWSVVAAGWRQGDNVAVRDGREGVSSSSMWNVAWPFIRRCVVRRLVVALSAQPSVEAACADFVKSERGVVAVGFPTARVFTALRFPLDGRCSVGDAAFQER